MTLVPRLALAAVLVTGLTACGGNDPGGGSGSSTSAAAPASSVGTSASSSPSPSALSSQEAQLIGIEAQAVGLDVAQWSVDHDFTDPADDAEFQKKITYAHSLSEGEKATYRKTGSRKFEVCVTKYAGADPAGWGIYESTSGSYTSGVGKPTAAFCP